MLLDSGVTLAFWSFYPPHTNSSKYPTWVTGRSIGVKPAFQSANVFLPLEGLDPVSQSATILLGPDDFDIAILAPHDPSQSPSWTSPVTNVTYATALKVSVNKKKLAGE